MKKILYLAILFCSVALIGTGCSKNEPVALRPTFDESSVVCDISSKTISFNADCPNGTKLQVLLRQKTNGTDELLQEARLKSSGQYYVSIIGLVGGSIYAYYIIGYDSNGAETFRSGEHTFTVPKYASPQAPSLAGIIVHSPSSLVATDGYLEGSAITKDIEYCPNGSETWYPVVVTGLITDLPPGKVILRKAETPTTEASKTASLIIPMYKSNTDMDGSNGTSEGLR